MVMTKIMEHSAVLEKNDRHVETLKYHDIVAPKLKIG